VGAKLLRDAGRKSFLPLERDAPDTGPASTLWAEIETEAEGEGEGKGRVYACKRCSEECTTV
jgi:hypothetical protein